MTTDMTAQIHSDVQHAASSPIYASLATEMDTVHTSLIIGCCLGLLLFGLVFYHDLAMKYKQYRIMFDVIIQVVLFRKNDEDEDASSVHPDQEEQINQHHEVHREVTSVSISKHINMVCRVILLLRSCAIAYVVVVLVGVHVLNMMFCTSIVPLFTGTGVLTDDGGIHQLTSTTNDQYIDNVTMSA